MFKKITVLCILATFMVSNCWALSPAEWVPLYEMSDKIDIAVSPQRYYHGPAMIVAPNGDWLIGFQDSLTHSGHGGVITQMRSTDQGKTWKRDGIVFDAREEGRFGRNPLYGVTKQGVIVLFVQIFNPDRKPLPSDPQRAGSAPLEDSVWLTSSDNGKTYKLRGTISKEKGVRVDEGAGRMVTLNGEVLFAGFRASPRLDQCGIWLFALGDLSKGWEARSAIFPSQDKGTELSYSTLIQRRGIGLCSYALTNDGVKECVSANGGKTWGKIAVASGLRVCNDPDMDYAGDVLVCHARGLDECSVMLFFSPDNGRNWGHPIVLDRYGPHSPDGAYTASVPYGKDGIFIAFSSDALNHRMADIRGVFLTKVRIRER